MKTKTLATTEELKKLLADAREKLRANRFNSQFSKEKDVHAVRKLRKEIAQMLTVLTSRIKA